MHGAALDRFANDTFLRALRREPTPYTPVWLMRQAGRYLPEYNATRARAGSFLALAQTPSLATEVTLQPLERFPLDAAILFSDILTVPDAMGLGLSFAEGEGPRFARTTADEARDRALAVPDMASCATCSTRCAEIKRALAGRVPLIGFAGSPFTLACYMIEGGGSDDFATCGGWRTRGPTCCDRLVDINARAVDGVPARADRRRRRRGDDVRHVGRVAHRRRVPRVLARPMRAVLRPARRERRADDRVHQGRRQRLAGIAACGASLRRARLDGRPRRRARRVGASGRAAGQSRSRWCCSPIPRRSRARRDRSRSRRRPGARAVFNLGHGIVPRTPPENVAALVEAVHAASRKPRVTRAGA